MDLLPTLWMPVWLRVALRRTHGGSHRAATLRWGALVVVYGFLLVLATSATAVAAVLLLST